MIIQLSYNIVKYLFRTVKRSVTMIIVLPVERVRVVLNFRRKRKWGVSGWNKICMAVCRMYDPLSWTLLICIPADKFAY